MNKQEKVVSDVVVEVRKVRFALNSQLMSVHVFQSVLDVG